MNVTGELCKNLKNKDTIIIGKEMSIIRKKDNIVIWINITDQIQWIIKIVDIVKSKTETLTKEKEHI